MRKKIAATVIMLVVYTLLTVVPANAENPTSSGPTVELPVNWRVAANVTYPNFKTAIYDSHGAGQLQLVNRDDSTDYIFITYENATRNYSIKELEDEAYKLYLNSDVTLLERGTMFIDGLVAGFVGGYNYDSSFTEKYIVFVNNSCFVAIHAHYTGSDTELEVKSLIDSINVPPLAQTNGSQGSLPSLPYIEYIILGVVLSVAILSVAFIARIIKHRRVTQRFAIGAFPVGWQFYEGLTAGDPPGTVYRFTKKKGKQRVGTIKAPEYPIEIDECREEVGNYTHRATMNTFTKFTGLQATRFLANMKAADELVLEMPGLMKETTSDVNLDPLIEQLINQENFHLRGDEQYFVIRAARKTMEINYSLTQRSIDDLGGEAALREANLKAKNLTYLKHKQVIKQKFDTYHRVMYNAEEIKLKHDKNGRIYIVR